MDFNIKWVHPCRFAIFTGRAILSEPLVAIINESPQIAQIAPFAYVVPLSSEMYDCGIQSISVPEDSTPSKYITVVGFEASLEVNESDATTGTFNNLEFLVKLVDYPTVTYTATF